ncbi:MAG: hypothetical protein FVQ81_09730 [Candidatus Glassbacteria bacterium]|nr:hypothetical protein [Candidatus Glassbacteria bacterium]
MATQTIFGGKVHLYKRPNSRFWQCSAYLAGLDRRVAKNYRTSVEMIEKHYAAHLKDMIDTSLVNVRRERRQRIEKLKKEDK